MRVPRHRATLSTATVLLALLPLGGCTGDPADVELEVVEQVTFATSLGVDLAAMTKLPEGVYVQDIATGTPPALAVGDSVVASYTGWIASGAEFGSGELRFQYGDTFIEGWNLGIAGMQLGGERRLVIPPELAYGRRSADGVPAGSVLVFRVQILSIF